MYFPLPGCILSMLYVMKEGASAETAVVGCEGMMGIALFMGGGTTPSRAVVQSAGYAYVLGARALTREFENHGGLQVLLLRYTQALITHVADGSLQSTSFSGSATVSLPAAEPGSPDGQ